MISGSTGMILKNWKNSSLRPKKITVHWLIIYVESKRHVGRLQDGADHAEGEQIDLFLRNFFIKHRMNDTLSNFQQEWYELTQKGLLSSGPNKIPQ